MRSMSVTVTLNQTKMAARLEIIESDFGMPTPQPPILVPGCVRVFGLVQTTPDGKQIGQSNFIVIVSNQRKEYVFYSTNVANVLQGVGCTLKEKVTFLQKSGKNITLDGTATYSMLRLFLSLLLFGRFDLNLLKQRYYKTFLCELERSCFFCYAGIFRNSPYWKFFKK